MTAIASLGDLINRLTGGNSGTPETSWWFKTPRIAGVAASAPTAGRLMSLWQYDGMPGSGATPTTAAIPDNATTGGFKQADPGGSRQKWLTSFAMQGFGAGGTLILYDRLLHVGGLSGTSTSAQTVGGTLTRYTDGLGNWAFAEVYSAIGASATTVKLSSYTNQAAVAAQVGQLTAIGSSGSNAAGRCFQLPLAAGDSGIQAVASVQLTATTGTAGNWGLTIGHPLAIVSYGGVGLGGWRDFTTGLPGLPEIKTDACLAMLFTPFDTTVPEMFGCAQFVEA